jgi:prepilin-type N-terminal cleavage/methylation domain-containing protein
MIFSEKERSVLSQRGFTLLEMVVAVTLVALMAVGIWSVFRISIRSWSQGTQFIDTNQRRRSILDLVRKQMASTYGALTPIDMQTGRGSYPIFSGTENSLRFISLNSLRFQESPGLTLVSYEAVQGRQGDYSLVEREERYLGQLPDQESPVNSSGEKTTEIFDNLTSFAFEYFDPGNGEDQPQWVKEWEGEKAGRLPTAILMTITSRDSKGNSLSRHMVVPIQAKIADPRMNFLSMPGGVRRQPLSIGGYVPR